MKDMHTTKALKPSYSQQSKDANCVKYSFTDHGNIWRQIVTASFLHTCLTPVATSPVFIRAGRGKY